VLRSVRDGGLAHRHAAVASHQFAVAEHEPGARRLQVVEDDEVGAPPGRHGPALVKAEVLRGVPGGEADGRHRVHAESDGAPDGVVDAAALDQVRRLAVVRAEAEAMLIGGGDRRHDRRRSRATLPSRIITIMPRRTFSSASSAVVDS